MTGLDAAAAIGQDEAFRARHEVDEGFDPYHYRPPGPVTLEFLRSRELTPFIMGPVGGGKTTTCAFKRIVACNWMPPMRDQVVRDRWVVVRDTFRSAEKTVLASWQQWFPKGYPGSTWTGGNDREVVHILKFRRSDGRICELRTEFVGLNGARVEAKMRGWEISGAWLNEADTLDDESLRYLEQRVGRYPKKDDLLDPSQPRFRQVIGDLNAPDVDNWIYKTFIEEPKPGRVLFMQPSGLSIDAENRNQLEPDYYDRIVATEEEWYVRRFVHNEFGWSRDGKPVYEQFNARLHVSPTKLDPVDDAELLIGLDGGGGTLNPAAVFLQPTPDGQLRVLDECYPGHGVGPGRFAEYLVQLLNGRYQRVRRIRAWADPAAEHGADKEAGELTWLETVQKAIGVPIRVPAGGSNEFNLRCDAVKAELRHLIDGRKPRIIVSKHCQMLIRGFASHYKFPKRAASAGGGYEAAPLKNEYSHLQDALQYDVLGFRGRAGVIEETARGGRSGQFSTQTSRPKQAARSGFDVGRY